MWLPTGFVDTDLYYFMARYYDSATGRFISVDPAGIDLADPQTFNRYTYCLNNPHKYVDPDGRILAFLAVLCSTVLTAYVATTIYYIVAHWSDFQTDPNKFHEELGQSQIIGMGVAALLSPFSYVATLGSSLGYKILDKMLIGVSGVFRWVSWVLLNQDTSRQERERRLYSELGGAGTGFALPYNGPGDEYLEDVVSSLTSTGLENYYLYGIEFFTKNPYEHSIPLP